jgi:hypothetical protein
MALDEPEGLTIRYQGKLCAVVFEYSRSVGLEPSHGCVFMELEDLGALEVKEIVPAALKGGAVASQEKPQDRPNERGLQSAGSLEFIEVAPNDFGQLEKHVVRFEQILVTEKAIEVSYATDDGKNGLAKVEITDIRYLWSSRGGICMWVNVPKPVDADAGGKIATGAEAAKEEHDALVEAMRQVDAAARKIDQLKAALEYTKAFIEREKLVAKTESEKKGVEKEHAFISFAPFVKTGELGVILKEFEDELLQTEVDLATNEAIVAGMQKNASEAAAKAASEKKPILTSESVELIPSSTDDGTPWTVRALLEKRVLPELWGAPKLKRIPADVAQALVGAKYWDPVVLPKKALQEVLDEFQLVFVLNKDSSCSLWKKNEGELRTEDASSQVLALPFNPDGSPNASVDQRVAAGRELVTFSRVPEVAVVLGAPIIRTARERLVPVGLRGGKIVPLVEALEGIGLTLDAAERFAVLDHEKRSAARLGVFEDGLKAFEAWAFKMFQLKGGVPENTERLPILEARAAFGDVGEPLPERVFTNGTAVVSVLQAALSQVNAAAAKVPAGNRKTFTDKALAQLKASKTSLLNALVNVDFGEQSTGYRIRRDLGIVEFGRVVGPVTSEGSSLGTCRLDSKEIRVELEFAYQVRPGYKLGTGVSFAQRYTAVFTRDGHGQAVQRPSIPAGTSPIFVHRPDLQLVEHLDGRSNKVILDKTAKALAQHQFDVALPKRGAVVECCRPVQVELNGSVLSATWAVNDEIPSTTAHIGSFAPLAPAPRLATRAFSDFGRLDRLAKDSVFAPKGLSQ